MFLVPSQSCRPEVTAPGAEEMKLFEGNDWFYRESAMEDGAAELAALPPVDRTRLAEAERAIEGE